MDYELDQEARAAASAEASKPTNSTHSTSASSSSSSGATAAGSKKGQRQQGGQKAAGQGSSSAAEVPPSSSSAAAARQGSGTSGSSPVAKGMAPAGLGSGFLNPRPQRKQQQQQQAAKDTGTGGYGDFLRKAWSRAQAGTHMAAGPAGDFGDLYWEDGAGEGAGDEVGSLLQQLGLTPDTPEDDLLQQLMRQYEVAQE